MNWSHIAQATSDVLTAVLIIRLLTLRLHNVYRVFCAFLALDLFASSVTFIEALIHDPRLDYRVTWIVFRVAAWILSLCMIYGLLHAILEGLPGILRFSRKLLNFTFILVVAIGLLSVRLDVAVSGSSGFLAGYVDPIGRAVRATFDLERVISTVALLVLVLILSFVLWFPVQMPRNLAIFSAGFVIYFAAKTALLLTRGMWSRESFWLVSNVIMFILSACCVYWTVFITLEGEKAPVRIGHRWQPREQDRLIGQLEAMNASLLRAARR